MDGLIIFFVLRGLLADRGAWYLIILSGIAIAVMLTRLWGVWALPPRHRDPAFPVSRRIAAATYIRSAE